MSIDLHWSQWPKRDRSLDPDGYTYVLEFSNGVVKVGKTVSPRGRAADHEKDVSRFGGTIVRWWLSELHREYHTNEVTLIAAGTRLGRVLGGVEYFADCSYDDVVAIARQLPATPSTLGERRAVKAKPHMEVRRQRAAAMRADGKSIRQIAAALQVAVGTVHDDLAVGAH